ncbi:MAG: PorP/SprF family type IX secretion system membrane protein [Crocinitomicaceae bacterium]
MKYLYLIISICFYNSVLIAQDYHFSQFDVSPIKLNPALTGQNNGVNYTAAMTYRNQWRSLSNKPFSNFNLSYEMPIDRRWGVGGYISNFDGAKVYNEFNMVVSGSYSITRPGNKRYQLTTGLQAGFINKNINDRDLTFNNQYENGGFNPDISSQENLTRLSKFVPEINWGIYYKYLGKSQNSKFIPYGGFSVFHITSPKQEFLEGTEETDRLPRRFVLHGGALVSFTREFTADIKVLNQWQGRGQEYFFGANFNYKIDYSTNTSVSGLLYYRVKDAVVVGFGIDYMSMRFITTYDITTSGLKSFNNSNGALEFSMIFAPKRYNK